MTLFLASQDAQEKMRVTESLSESCFADLTDVTLVSDDTYRRLDWCYSGEKFTDEDEDDEDYDDDESWWWWWLSCDESYPIMKIM